MNVAIGGIKSLDNKLGRLIGVTRSCEVFLNRLAEIGIKEAKIRFDSAEYDGTNDVVVGSSPEWINDSTLAIYADGEAIAFIEFGAGVYNPVTHPKANEFGMIRGEYGLGQGKQEKWTYVGEPGTNGVELENGRILTRGNNANRCMWLSAEVMRNSISAIAKEVFGG